VRSKALNRVFNRALVDLEYRRELFADLRRMLAAEGVPERELRLLKDAAPQNIWQLAQVLEKMHASTFPL